MDLAGNAFNALHESIFYLRLPLPRIGSGKAMEVACWFHGLFFPMKQKSGVQDKGRWPVSVSENKRRVTKIANRMD